MTMARSAALALLSGMALLFACGPRISEVRLVTAPAHAPECQLEFVKLDMVDLSSPTGTWQVIGHVSLGDIGKQDPFAEANRALVRPRACAMGGEAVSIMSSATNEGLVTDGSRTNYAILKHRTTEAEAPKTF